MPSYYLSVLDVRMCVHIWHLKIAWYKGIKAIQTWFFELILQDYEQGSLCYIKVKIQFITRKYILDLQTLKSM